MKQTLFTYAIIAFGATVGVILADANLEVAYLFRGPQLWIKILCVIGVTGAILALHYLLFRVRHGKNN